MKTTEQKNRMIAEFMGKEIYQYHHESFYHTSWDWLMPVVKECFSKIEIFEYDSDMYEHSIECIFHPDFTLNAFMNGEINDIHERVVEFIEWYNENK